MGGSNMHQVKKNIKKCKKSKENVKVVYISSPLMVTTSASQFRSLVQELTGRHSDITELLENNYDNYQVFNRPATTVELDPKSESPSSSESLFDLSEDVFVKDGFLDLLRTELLFDASELDVLGSYDAL